MTLGLHLVDAASPGASAPPPGGLSRLSAGRAPRGQSRHIGPQARLHASAPLRSEDLSVGVSRSGESSRIRSARGPGALEPWSSPALTISWMGLEMKSGGVTDQKVGHETTGDSKDQRKQLVIPTSVCVYSARKSYELLKFPRFMQPNFETSLWSFHLGLAGASPALSLCGCFLCPDLSPHHTCKSPTELRTALRELSRVAHLASSRAD